MTSFTGGAAAGWIFQTLDVSGPIMYHTGDTNKYTDMEVVDRVYKPTHVILPIGEGTMTDASVAAQACHIFLKHCHTVIPMYFPKSH